MTSHKQMFLITKKEGASSSKPLSLDKQRMTGDLKFEVDVLLTSNLSIHWTNCGGSEEDNLHVHCDITTAA